MPEFTLALSDLENLIDWLGIKEKGTKSSELAQNVRDNLQAMHEEAGRDAVAVKEIEARLDPYVAEEDEEENKKEEIAALRFKSRQALKKAQALESYLFAMYEFVKDLKASAVLDKYTRFSKGIINAWWEMIGAGAEKDLKAIFPYAPTALKSEKPNEYADKIMTGVYLGLNIAGCALAAFALGSVNLGNLGVLAGGTATSATAATWNYIDVIGGVVQGWHEMGAGNYYKGTSLFVSSGQLTASTLAANIGQAVGTVGGAAAVGLTGFSFAACMFIACGADLASIYQTNKRIKALETKQTPVMSEIKLLQPEIQTLKCRKDMIMSSPAYTTARDGVKSATIELGKSRARGCLEDIKRDEQKLTGAKLALQDITSEIKDIQAEIKPLELKLKKLKMKNALYNKTILHEKAKKANLGRSATSWAACGVAMTAVAVAGFLAANVATMGGLAALTVAVAGVAVLTGLIRKWWVQRRDYEANLKTALDKGLEERIGSLPKDTLEDAGIHLDRKAELKSFKLFKSTNTLRTYLKEMMYKDLNKAEALIKALEETPPNKDTFKAILAQKRDSLDMGKTTGAKLFDAMDSKGSDTDDSTENSQQTTIATRAPGNSAD